MAIAKGAAKQLRLKRQPAKGTLAIPTTGGQIVRRRTSNLLLAKESYTTEEEQTSTRQVTSLRHGPKTVNGSLSGILSPGTYADYFSAILMRDFAPIAAVAGASITVAGVGPTYTITRAAGDWLADGAKIGRGVRLTAGAFNAANLNKNLLVIGATATVLTVLPMNKSAMVAEGPIATATATFPGSVTYVPTTGHTDVYYTGEEWFPDVPRSQVSSDLKFTAATLRLPGSGNATVDFTMLGLDQFKNPGDIAYFVAPLAETTSDALVAASGALYVGGTLMSVVTDATVTFDARGAVGDAAVGTDVRPDVFLGKVAVTGSLTTYFTNGTIPDNFINEDEIAIALALTTNKTGNADFITITINRIKLTSVDGDDPETGMKRTFNFQGLFNKVGGAALSTLATTIEMQDSLA
jgi:hypothetical protein